MKTTITTRQFDDEGRCVKETTCEYDYTPEPTQVGKPLWQWTPQPYYPTPNYWYTTTTNTLSLNN